MTYAQRIRQQLTEAFATSFNNYGDYVEVFVNPDLRELQSLNNALAIRFLIDPLHKKFYVWDAGLAIHDTVYKQLHNKYFSKGISPYNELIDGLASWFPSAKKLDVTDISLYNPDLDLSWLKYYYVDLNTL